MRFLAIVLAVLAGNAIADSDSYFCTAPGYLAYELREWSAPEKRHVLKVVFVGGAEGISEPSTAPLEDFQLHGMKCGTDRIEIEGWDKKYTLSLPALKMISVESRQPGGASKDYEVASFNSTRRPEAIAIASSSPERRYQLQIEYRANPVRPGLIHHETTSTLIERDARGKVLRRAPIHRGIVQETGD